METDNPRLCIPWSAALLLLSVSTAGLAQKVEVERRIRVEEFPAVARQYLSDQFPGTERMKYYREHAVDSMTFEAKFRLNDDRYSVEFDPAGRLLDIEKQIPYIAIPLEARKAMENRWQGDFRKFRPVKSQEQRVGPRLRFEIEVKGKDAGGTAFYEYLFEADGTFIGRERILLRPSDITLY